MSPKMEKKTVNGTSALKTEATSLVLAEDRGKGSCQH
jgi:hypothetical protein